MIDPAFPPGNRGASFLPLILAAAVLGIVGVSIWMGRSRPPLLPPPVPPAPVPADPLYGRAEYVNCQACHGQGGIGLAGIAPALLGSGIVRGSPDDLVRLVLKGVPARKPFPMAMPGFARLDDDEVAAVLTYIRRSWGNSAEPVTSSFVARIRLETPFLEPR